jgi:hypothetical protein
MRGGARLIGAVLAAGALTAASAIPAGSAPTPPTGWDGTNPFHCELQNAGFGPTGPHPEADPYCVDFDKRHQNVTELGVVQFLSLEPARVAAASPKCFYFQSDHWRGSVVQDDGSTKTYEWDGHYFFDKARGEGGAWVTNFNVNGHTGDPSAMPGMPPDWARYFGPGTGGVVTHNEVQADPSCAAKAGQDPQLVYGSAADGRGCPKPSGGVDAHRVGPIALGDTERRVRDLLGVPARVKRGFLRYCQEGAGKYLVGVPGDRSGAREIDGDGAAPVVFLLTTNMAYATRGIARGARASALRRAYPHARRVLRQGRTRVLALTRRRGLIAGVRAGRVRFVAVYDAGRIRTRRALAEWLRRSQ